MFRAPVYRSDLFLALAHAGGDAREREAIARLWGFEAGDAKEEEKSATITSPAPLPQAPPRQETPAPPSPGDHFPLWRATRLAVTPEETLAEKRRPCEKINTVPHVTVEQLSERHGAPLPGRPLIRWARLWPFLKRILGHHAPSSTPDIPQTVKLLALCRPLTRLPFRPRLKWHPRVRVLVDRRDGLAPFWGDYDRLLRRLGRIRGANGLSCTWLAPDSDSPTGFADVSPAVAQGRDIFRLPRGGTAVLALGDLAQYLGGRHQQAWLSLGRRLRASGIRPWALCPCPPSRWDSRMARAWNLAAWDRNGRLPLGPRGRMPDHGGETAVDANTLSRMLSPAVRVEMGLLRDLRMLLPQAEVGLEYDLFQAPDTTGNPLGLMFQGGRLRDIRATLREETPDRLAPVVAAILRHHAYAPAYLHFEILALRYWLVDGQWNELVISNIIPGDALEKATIFYQGFLRSVRDQHPGFSDAATAGVLGRDLERLDTNAFATQTERQIAWVLAADLKPGDPLPDHIDSAVIAWVYHGLPAHEPNIMHGEGLIAGGRPGAGRFPMVGFKARERIFTVSKGGITRLMEWSGQSVFPPDDLRANPPIAISSGGEKYSLEQIFRPAWARRMWYDGYGLAAEFAVAGVAFVLRWISPGRFLMGSPEDEPGRWKPEGPQREVVIREGFWLGETTVTQAQWRTVTGNNPSHFKGPVELPVEQVSWEDCNDYCAKLNALGNGPVFRLPKEEEWEYACRAGTETALWTGGITIKGDSNAPELDAIAWYGGNSGQELEVENPYDAKDWPERQYKDAMAGTHRVKLKAANPWGLHDMLGNVWEWCEDLWDERAYEKSVAGETMAAAEERADRVVRGGAWDFRARFCRAAFRFGSGPGPRWLGLGLRLAAGQELGGGAAGSGSDPAGGAAGSGSDPAG
ncbi:MAG: formylglycine-generating enzyme family protein [Verrucomicrobia bacterium]|nr:formylglycine-generating enzyme family protein [Verrucomicrobiota bacterium]